MTLGPREMFSFPEVCAFRWWWADRSHCHELSLLLQGLGPPWILGRPSLRLCSHSKEALGQEAGRQGYSLENGRTLGALAGAPEAAAAAAVVRCTTHWAGSPSGGRLRGLLGAWAQAQADRQDVGCRSTRPPRGALLASSTLRLQQGRALGEGKCVGQTG